MFDGALAHLSKLVHDTLRREIGFVINWGPPGHFERRPNVERTFKRITDDIFLRLPSTTGSDPKSGRADDAAGAAMHYRIRADDVEQLLDVVFAEHNGLPGQGNFYNSPLETLQYFLNGPSPRVMLRKLPFAGSTRARLLLRRELCTVRGGVKSGRKPYIQFENVLYTSPLLSTSVKLVNTELTIYVDDEDLRTVKAFTSNGYELGILTATRGWNLTKHSLATRKAIFQLVSRRILVLSQSADPVQVYLLHLAKHVEKSSKGGKGSLKDSTDLARVAKEADVTPTLASASSDGVPIDPAVESTERSHLRLVPPSQKRYKVTNR
ncbi:hypothetical protein [Paraburkholderia sp. MM5477-R1]|uniref:hypothetical protein n=1 Tax=Paraburkholderia sp. MM5477-R1 TaxID=2991062 RepID=UPI003D19E055